MKKSMQIANGGGLKNKAFTLIELLAVIVILGVIALIVSPIVIGAMEKSEKAAFARSIDGIIESVRIDHSDDSFLAPREYYYEKTDLTLLTVGDNKRDEMVNINGQIDGNGFVHVDGEGNITIDNICNSKYCASGDEDDITITDNEDGTITDFDKNDPVITLNGKAIVYVELNGTYKEEGATARTKVGDKLEYTTEIKKDNKVVESINTKEEGTYEITYITTHNEKTVSVTRTVAVLEMTPVITITEPNPNYVKNQEILVSVSAIKPNTVTGFTVEIKKDGTSESKETVTGLTKTLNLNTTGVYEVIVIVIDNNNHKKIASKTYKIDTTGPVITFNPETVTLETEEVNNYNLLTGVTVKDNVDGPIEVNATNVQTTGSLLKTPNTYQITYTASDKLGNTSTKVRTFVVQDATKPVITITPNEQSTFVKTKTITINATDNIKLNSISYILIKDGVRGASTPINNGGTVTVNSTGNYQIEVTATDSSDNSATKTSGTYKIDTTVPTITLTPETVTLKVNEVTGYNLMMGASASDNSGINPTITYEGSLSATVGTQTVTYKATDQAGNVTTKVRTFNITKADAPVLNFSSISSNNLWIGSTKITATASDIDNLTAFSYSINGGAETSVAVNGKSASVEIPLSSTGTYTIKIKATGSYQNSAELSSGTYKIDTTKPTVSGLTATTAWSTSNKITGTGADSHSGISYYAVTKTSSVPTSWTSVTNTSSYSISYTATSNGTYYVWVKDKVGNYNYGTVTVSRVDNTTPTITARNTPYTAEVGTNFATTNFYTVSYGPSGGSTVCRNGSTTVTNVNSLGVGSYTLTCTATSTAGKSASVNISVTIKNQSYIYYTTYRNGYYDLNKCNVDGTNCSKINSLSYASGTAPVVSVGTNYMYYTTYRNGYYDLNKCNVDGTNCSKINSLSYAIGAAPVVSAGTNYMYYTTYRNGYYDLNKCNADGTNCSKINSLSYAMGTAPVVSVGTNYMYYTTYRNGYYDLNKCNADGTNCSKINSLSYAIGVAPVVSVGTNYMYYTTYRNGYYDLNKCNADGTNCSIINSLSYAIGVAPVVSVGTNYMYYTAYRNGYYDLNKCNVDGTNCSIINSLSYSVYNFNSGSTTIMLGASPVISVS